MACALSGSSQEPNASTRCGSEALVTSVVSPRMSGSLSAAAHETRICGSDINSALKRSRSALSAMISSRNAASADGRAQPRAHQHDGRDAPRTAARRASAPARRCRCELSYRAKASRIDVEVHATLAAESARSAVAGFPACRCAPAQPVLAATAYESLGLYAQAESRRKSPDRERGRWRRGVAGSDLWNSEPWRPRKRARPCAPVLRD